MHLPLRLSPFILTTLVFVFVSISMPAAAEAPPQVALETLREVNTDPVYNTRFTAQFKAPRREAKRIAGWSYETRTDLQRATHSQIDLEAMRALLRSSIWFNSDQSVDLAGGFHQINRTMDPETFVTTPFAVSVHNNWRPGVTQHLDFNEDFTFPQRLGQGELGLRETHLSSSVWIDLGSDWSLEPRIERVWMSDLNRKLFGGVALQKTLMRMYMDLSVKLSAESFNWDSSAGRYWSPLQNRSVGLSLEAAKSFRRLKFSGAVGAGRSVEPPNTRWDSSVQGWAKMTYGYDGETQVSLGGYRFMALSSDVPWTSSWSMYNVQLSVSAPL